MKLYAHKLLSHVPRRLPVGLPEFYTWSDRIIALSGKFADPDSMRFALASQIMHLGAQKSKVPDAYFVASMEKAAANQVASQVFQDIKTRQQEAALAAQEAAKLAEATASSEGDASNDQKAN